MKKSILALAVVLGASSTFAQDLTSKKGENYLPEAGDWAISVNANPFLSYVGNFFGKTANNTAPAFNFSASNNAIMGKYFVEDGMAYRVGLNIGFGSNTTKELVPSTAPSALATDRVENVRKMTTSGIALTAGLEWRKGTTRLQGFYGAEVGVGFGGGSKSTYTYGNDFVIGGTPVSNTFVLDGVTDTREIHQKGGLTFGIRGFIGAEYFVLPKLSLGGEFGWGLGLTTQGEKSETIVVPNSTFTDVEDQTNITTSKVSDFRLGTDNMSTIFSPSGQLKISFHF